MKKLISFINSYWVLLLTEPLAMLKVLLAIKFMTAIVNHPLAYSIYIVASIVILICEATETLSILLVADDTQDIVKSFILVSVHTLLLSLESIICKFI